MKNAYASNKIHDSEATLMTWSLYDTNSVCMSIFFFIYIYQHFNPSSDVIFNSRRTKVNHFKI